MLGRFFGVASNTASTAKTAGGAGGDGGGAKKAESEYAILPRQTSDELQISEHSSKLDTALAFLQRDIGYALLDDVRDNWGGGARFQRRDVGGLPMPPSASHRDPRPDDDEKATMKPRGSAPTELIIDVSFSVEVPEISPDAARYAVYDEDLVVARRFVSLIHQASPSFQEKMSDGLYKMVLKTIRLLHLCDYDYADVILVMAHTSVYFRTAYQTLGSKMDQQEAAHVCTLLMFLAHSFVLDETCPLRCWQKHLFRQYCNTKVLSAALLRLFKMRRWILRITIDEEKLAMRSLAGKMLTAGADMGMIAEHTTPVGSSSSLASTGRGLGSSTSSAGSSGTGFTTASVGGSGTSVVPASKPSLEASIRAGQGAQAALAILGNLGIAKGLIASRKAGSLSEMIPQGLTPDYIAQDQWSRGDWYPDKRVQYILLLDKQQDAYAGRGSWFGGPQASFAGLLQKLNSVTHMVFVTNCGSGAAPSALYSQTFVDEAFNSNQREVIADLAIRRRLVTMERESLSRYQCEYILNKWMPPPRPIDRAA